MINSAKEVMFLHRLVGLSVRMIIATVNSYGLIFTKFWKGMNLETKNYRLNFGFDLDPDQYYANPGFCFVTARQLC